MSKLYFMRNKTKKHKTNKYKKRKTNKYRKSRRKSKTIKNKKKTRNRRKRGGNIKNIQKPQSLNSLLTILANAGITEDMISKWKKSPSKLFKEIQDKETKLVLINGKIKRLVDTVSIKIYDGPQKRFLLYEVGHYDNEKNKTKNRNNPDIREKMIENENPREAIKRGISEELGNKYSKNIRFFKGSPTMDIDNANIEEEDSNSYPGLAAIYKWYNDEAYIPDLTNDTLYSNNDRFYWHKELNENGSFKRWIKWQWKLV